jgi:hypothetical protein
MSGSRTDIVRSEIFVYLVLSEPSCQMAPVAYQAYARDINLPVVVLILTISPVLRYSGT